MQRKTNMRATVSAHLKNPTVRFAGHLAARPASNLSQAELRRIVAEMLG